MCCYLTYLPNEGEQVVKTVKFVNFAIAVKIVKSAAPLFVSVSRKSLRKFFSFRKVIAKNR